MIGFEYFDATYPARPTAGAPTARLKAVDFVGIWVTLNHSAIKWRISGGCIT